MKQGLTCDFQPAEPSVGRREIMERAYKPRVLLGKPGLDGHDRGVKVVARALRDAGMEVIYTGLRQTPEMIVEAALQEDVDAVGLSILSGAHMALMARVMVLMAENDMSDIPVFLGGIIPDDDVVRLNEMGVEGVFGPGASLEEIVTFIWDRVSTRPAEEHV
jgi:methylmalonyl-CoA mutase C-terminal domain/subunit